MGIFFIFFEKKSVENLDTMKIYSKFAMLKKSDRYEINRKRKRAYRSYQKLPKK